MDSSGSGMETSKVGFMNKAMKSLSFIKPKNLLTSSVNVSFPKKSLFYEVS
jgi:hypothetical protein